MSVYVYYKNSRKCYAIIKEVVTVKCLNERFLIYHNENVTQIPKERFMITVYGY